jgi:glycosyltransferase involved in cell wall biosynthesis
MRIVVVCDAVTDYLAGSFISALRFAELLSKKHKVIFISSKYPNMPDINYYKGIKIYRLFAFPVPKTKGKLYLSFPNCLKVKKILKKEKADIVHIMIPSPLGLSAIKAARALNLKVVAHSHTQPENWGPYIPGIFSKEKFFGFAYKYIISIYNRADIVICPSKFSADILKSKGLKVETKVISNGVDAAKFRRVKYSKGDLKRFGLSENTKKLLFVGRIDPEKNIDLIIKSVPLIERKFKNFEICIVGEGIKKDYLENFAKQLGVSGKVKFLGRVSDKDLIKAYSLSDIFILPSLVELEGMVVLEAMACGLPVLIAKSKDSAASQFVNNNGFLFNPKSANDLAEKCVKLLKNLKLLKKMAVKSYKNSKEYHIAKSIRSLEEVYRNLVYNV